MRIEGPTSSVAVGNSNVAALPWQRPVIAVLANAPLRAALVARLERDGFDVRIARTPLDAIQLLLAEHERIGMLVVAPDASWASGLQELVADEFPTLRDRLVA